ncbi:TadE/TadG family type IV pilus assembly protein [Arthrobacter sp. Z1-9]
MTTSTRGQNPDRALDMGRKAGRPGKSVSHHPAAREAGSRERGSAVVDFVLVGILLTLFFLAIIQLALVLHVRNTLIDAAASGARYGTLADRGAADAEERTRSLIQSALNAGFAQQVSTSEVTYQGLRTLEVTVRAPMPVVGLIGPRDLLEVKGHAAIQP